MEAISIALEGRRKATQLNFLVFFSSRMGGGGECICLDHIMKWQVGFLGKHKNDGGGENRRGAPQLATTHLFSNSTRVSDTTRGSLRAIGSRGS